MPFYMDRHYVEGATAHAVAVAHTATLAGQDRYRVRFMTYWFDEVRSTAFCLVDSPDKETVRQAHYEWHGIVLHEIIEVDPAVVEAFLAGSRTRLLPTPCTWRTPSTRPSGRSCSPTSRIRR